MNIEITSRNSRVLRTDIAYNLVNEEYLVNDAITLMKIAIKRLEEKLELGTATADERVRLRTLKTAINYASI